MDARLRTTWTGWAPIGSAPRVRRYATATVLVLALALGLYGCAPPLVQRWQDPAFHGPALHRLLVAGMQGEAARRHAWEDSMVRVLRRQGIIATPAYRLLPGSAPSTDQLTAVAVRGGFQGVVVTRSASTGTALYWMPGQAGLGFGWRWRDFDYWDATRGPGFVEAQPRADYQTDVFAIARGGSSLIWSGTTRGLNPSSISEAADAIGRALVPTLKRGGIVGGDADAAARPRHYR